MYPLSNQAPKQMSDTQSSHHTTITDIRNQWTVSSSKRLRTELHADSTRSRHQLRPSEDQVAKVEILAIAQPPARIEALLHLPARFSCVHVPEVEPMLIQDHDPLLETNTGLRRRGGWARLGEQFRPRVRTRLRTFLGVGKVRKTPSPGASRAS